MKEMKTSSKVLVVDVGGTHVKVMVNTEKEERKADSGPEMSASKMVSIVKKMTEDWQYDAISIGYPGLVMQGKPVREPANLGKGWVGFDFEAAFGRPVKVVNDAAMQAIGSYEGGRMLFLGLGTGLGSAMIVNGDIEALELAHLPYKKNKTYEDFVGVRGLERLGKKKWREMVFQVINDLSSAMLPDYIVIGGGNVAKLKDLPPNCRRGSNTNAFEGGFRLWNIEDSQRNLLGRTSMMSSNEVVQPGDILRMSEIEVAADIEGLSRVAAFEFIRLAKDAINARGRFTVALSGGQTPKGLYSLLASDPSIRSQVPWDKVFVFWGDERHVPPDQDESNFHMANEVFLSKVSLPETNIFRIKSEYPEAAEAACEYEQQLREFFQLGEGGLPRFDLILLGLGPEAHTASLFPGTSALQETEKLIVANWVGKFYSERITMTVPVLNNASCVMFLVSGEEKAMPLKAVLEGPYDPIQLPAQLIHPQKGRLVWLIDKSAASRLEAKTA